MIEKLDPIKHTDNLYDKNGFITNVACGGVVISKINELVDAVNTIQKERELERFEIQEWIGILEAVRKSVNIHEKQIDELQMKLEPEKCVTGTTADKLLDPTPSMLEEALENIKKEEERKTLKALTPDYDDTDDIAEVKNENLYTKSIRMDKEFAEEEMERLQKELSRTKKQLEAAKTLITEIKTVIVEQNLELQELEQKD